MVEIRAFTDGRGRQPFRRWYDGLDRAAAARVDAALARIADGNHSSIKGLGGGLLECRLHFGPGYRVYFGRDGRALVILLAGGTKDRQHQDIEKARGLWREYRRSQREEA
ncbi:MAG: type II toxin-antitoxin system RelE/ParE family toxin [Acidimicrobiaceae bacterium]|nr:type II toxin-antitoxin system RelE/ParE family toxin [Acidimicrobiaceae bacterium]